MAICHAERERAVGGRGVSGVQVGGGDVEGIGGANLTRSLAHSTPSVPTTVSLAMVSMARRVALDTARTGGVWLVKHVKSRIMCIRNSSSNW